MTLPEHVAGLLRQPEVPAWVGQRQGTRFELGWRARSARVDVWLLPRQGGGEEVLLASVRGEQGVWVETTAVRPYFALQFFGGVRDGQRLLVAERQLPHGLNLRDIGGYVGENGRFTRWGAVYRSGGLDELDDADLAYMAQLGLQTVCDLRTDAEVAARPDRLPQPPPRQMHLAMKSKDGRLQQLYHLWRHRNRFDQLLRLGYTRTILTQNAARLSIFLHQLAEPASLPLLLHCTAGKDRTGVLVAVLLLLLGVDEATVLADYSLSNRFYADFRRLLQADVQRLGRFGYEPARLEPFYLADPAVLAQALAVMRRKYGSIEQFVVQQAGVRPAVLAQLRDNLLVDGKGYV